jgi:hypothetical protein
MHALRHAAAALVIGALAPVALTAPGSSQTCACAPGGGGYVIQADEPPPPLPEYDQPPLPAPGYYWTPGYWAWNNYDYYWVPGAWVEPPQPGLLWTPGYWAYVAGVYAFTPGYWGPHVGFYGGVDYGFGYNGAGYFGGRWDNGQYFYNSAANNIGAAHIANVYNQSLVNNPTASRVSFNGGAGGVAARPTNEQLLAAKEPRVPATRPQVDHARASGMRGEQFLSTNQGKPAIAATERPGEFKGKGVVPARAAGKAAQGVPAPGGNAEPEPKERPPAAEKPVKPEAAPNAPKIEERPPAVERPVKPEAAPNAPKIEEKPRAVEKPVKPEAAPSMPKIEERPPAVERPVRPELPPAPAQPGFQQRAPAAERPAQPGPPNGMQRFERPPGALPRPLQPERKPEAKECGRPGLPPCPR